MRVRRLLLGLLAVAAALVCVPVVFIARAMLFPPTYDVVSIATLPSYQDAKLLERAWALPAAAAMKDHLLYQPNGSFCGPTSVADVERSLRRYDATPKEMLAGSGLCPLGFCMGGIELDHAASLARAQGHEAKAVRDLSLEQFRAEMKHTNDANRRYIINFNRGLLFGKGVGHFSPIGGYLEAEDLVFVLDVNEHYHPWLVPTERLWKAMDSIDSSSGKKRGLVIYEL